MIMTGNQSNTEVAHALILALQYDFIDHLAIREWADELIENSDSPEPWLLDLAFCSPKKTAAHLREVPGEPCIQIVHNILSGIVCAEIESCAIDKFELRDVGWAHVDVPSATHNYCSNTYGQLRESATPSKIASALISNGVNADYNRTSTRVLECSAFQICFHDGSIGLNASAENIARMLVDARLVSNALTSAGIVHRFEVHDHNGMRAEYLHHNWPPET